jgi:protein gp37
MTKIEWTNETWNPIVGCSKVSEGCQNCYAEKMAIRVRSMLANNITPSWVAYDDVVDMDKKAWNGKTHLVLSAFEKPFHWRKPRKVFVCSMGDLFHESVPFAWITNVFAVIMANPQHTFQILTKRPDRMLEWFNYIEKIEEHEVMQGPEKIRYLAYKLYDYKTEFNNGNYWPLKNLWIGVSAENKEQANKRIPILFKISAAVRFVSIEPMLGAIDLDDFTYDGIGSLQNQLDWVILGGESGHHARPLHPDWVRSIRDQCKATGIPFFFKQWGEWIPVDHCDEDNYWAAKKSKEIGNGIQKYLVFKVGKKRAGNLLDGKRYEEFPNTK